MTLTSRVVATVTVALLIVALAPPSAAQADSIRNREWIISALGLTKAHKYSEGKGVVVAVIDSGVDATHADLVGNVLNGVDVSNQTPHGNGQIDTVGHGTAVAGLIAAHGHGPNDASGVMGVAPQAKILPVKDGTVLGTGIVQAIEWALRHGARVICIAQGQPDDEPAIDRAIAAAERDDIVIVAAVGNVPETGVVNYPAADAGVVAAAGTDERGNHATVSVSGPQIVLAAPATDIVQPYPDHKYALGTGTSASTAIIAGAAALVRSRFPKLSATEVIHRLTATAIDKGPPGRDNEYGYGLINIVAALTAKVPPASPSASSSAPTNGITTRPNPATTSAVPASKSSTGGIIGIVAAIVAVLAVLTVWLVARRRVQR